MSTETLETDLAVIGAGPGGYAAAFHAADHGLQVALIDPRPQPGGVCLNIGCIPSKALLHAAALLEEAKLAKSWGIDFGEPKVDISALREWKESVVKKLTGGLAQLCKARGVRFIQGTAVFVDSERVTIEDSPTRMVIFKHAILATGSSPVIPASLRTNGDSKRVMDSTAALELSEVPARLLVVGGGYIGLELATVYAALGSRVTIVEMTEGLLPGVDRDLVRPVLVRLKHACDSIRLQTQVAWLKESAEGIQARMDPTPPAEGQIEAPEKPVAIEETFDRVLIAVGRRPNSGGVGLENTKARIDRRGFVQVDAQRRTDDPNIYAIGDVAGEPMLAHKATREGIVAAGAILGEASAFDPRAIPAVVFTNPEIATCGLSETQAETQKISVEVRRFPWPAASRAVTLDRTEGLTKLICDPSSGAILGMGIVGAGAGELIAEGVLAIEMGATAEDLALTIHPHPTLSETVMETGELFFGSSTSLHRPPRKKG